MTARMQVLYQLPGVVDGDRRVPRYALVVDQAAELPESDRDALRAFASELGAQGCVVLSGTVDLMQGEDDEDDGATQALTEVFRQAMATPAFDAPPTAPQPPKLPPANTTEGKMARSWQARDQLQGDPQ